MKRLDVLPGITGLAQVSGRNDISIIEKINLDIEYVEKINIFLDIKIVFKTFISIFSKKGNNSDKFAIKNELDELKNQWKNKPKVKENETPKGMVLIIQMLIVYIRTLVVEILGPKLEKLTPYFLYLFSYMLLSNFISLFVIGFRCQKISYLKKFCVYINIKGNYF